MQAPFLIKLDKTDLKQDYIEDNIVNTAPNMIHPMLSLGFHYFIRRTRESMIKITKDIYYVVNPFEITISNFEDDIQKSQQHYFKTKKEYSDEFYKLWEILYMLKIGNEKTLNSLILSKNHDELEDSIKFYREKIDVKSSKDSYDKDGKSLKSEEYNLIVGSEVLKHETEYDTFPDLIEKIIKILKHQSENGHSVIKIYDTYTFITLRLIYILRSFFDEAYIYKPYVSRPTIPEKYLILKKFKNNKMKKDVIEVLEKILKETESKNYITSVFNNLILPRNFINTFRYINIRLNNIQQIMINDIIVYINENDFFGDKYHTYRDKQIECSKWWIKNFFPPSVNIYEKNIVELDKIYKSSQEKINLETNKFIENIV